MCPILVATPRFQAPRRDTRGGPVNRPRIHLHDARVAVADLGAPRPPPWAKRITCWNWYT